MDPKNPDVLYAATYDKQRLPWQMVNGGPGQRHPQDAPTAAARGRSSAADCRRAASAASGSTSISKNPDILYAVIENENPRAGAPPPRRPARRATTIGGEVYRTDDGGQTWKKMNADDFNVSPKGPYYFSQIRVDPGNDQHICVTQDGYRHSLDGGKTWNAPAMFPRMFGDFRTLWIDPENSDRMIAGSDGGIAISYDGGRTSDHYANIPVGEIYSIGVDMEDPYNIYAGLQDHEHWKGPSNGPLGRVTVWDWLAVGDNDGIFTQVDPTDSRWLYTTRQYGGHTRVDQKHGLRDEHLAAARPQGDPYRFQWSTPLHISPHDRKMIYAGAQLLLRSTDRGDHWTEISPDLSTNDHDAKILPRVRGRRAGRHSVVRDHVDFGIAGDDGRDLGRHERRQGAGHAQRRRRLDRRDRRRSPPPADARTPTSAASARRRMSRAAPTCRRAATGSTTSGRISTAPTTSARRGRRSPATCRTSRSTSSARTRRIRTCCSSATTRACSCRSTAARAG